jgi:protease II
VLEEKDELFDLPIGKTRDEKFLVLTSESKDANEQSLIDADVSAREGGVARRLPAPGRRRVRRRPSGRQPVRAHQRHRRNFRLVKVDAAKPELGRAEELIASRDRVMLDDFDVFADDLVVTERVAGSLQSARHRPGARRRHTVAFDEPAYAVHTSGNAEFETRSLRFVYTSMTTPASTYDYRLDSRERVLRKRQPVPGYDPALYQSERVMARRPTAPRSRSRSSGGATGSAPVRSRCCFTATAATASLSTPGSRRRGCRCSTAASSSRSPTSAAAATSAAPGTRRARWRARRRPSATSSPAPRR